jgi:hypothetical protein
VYLNEELVQRIVILLLEGHSQVVDCKASVRRNFRRRITKGFAQTLQNLVAHVNDSLVVVLYK